MWAHYADKHKGVVIGIDANNVWPVTDGSSGILMRSVSYSEDRPKINVIPRIVHEEFREALYLKSVDWSYEKEFRSIFTVDFLKIMQQQGLAQLKNFNGKKTWFLRLNPHL